MSETIETKPKGVFPHLAGKPPTYNPVRLPEIIEAVYAVEGSLTQVAWRCGFSKVTFRDWVARGDEDISSGSMTDFAHLSIGIRRAQSEIVRKLAKRGLKGKTNNGKFIQWWLSVVFRQDFGIDAGLLEALLDRAAKLEQGLNRMDARTPSQAVMEDQAQDRLEDNGQY